MALNGRWRILGKSDTSWHESIALLVAIYEETGNIEADGYLALLPEGYRRVCASRIELRLLTSKAHRREAKFSALCLAYDTDMKCHQKSQRAGAEESQTQQLWEKITRSISELEAFLRVIKDSKQSLGRNHQGSCKT